MSLKKEAVLGMVWVFADAFIIKGISFIGSIFLARLLIPSDFGLIAMISIFISIGTVFLDSGLSSSLIRNNNNDECDYSTIFYINIFLSCIVYVFFFITSPLIAEFYNQEILILIIRVYCISFFIGALTSVQMTILIKEMKFKKIALINIPGVIIGSFIGILMAYKDYGVWSIIGMYLTNQFILLVIIWIVSDWKPKFIFSFKKLKYHYDFGYKLFISSIITSIFGNIYNVIIGKFYSIKTTGNFERGYMFNQYPLIVLTQIIGKVTFPLLANIKEDEDRFREIFIKLVNFTFFITAPIMLILSACSKPLILLVLGEKWSGVIQIFSILCIGGIFYTLQALNVNVLKIFGRSDYILKGEIYLRSINLILVICAALISFELLLWSFVLNSILTLLVNMYYCNITLGVTINEQLKSIFPILIISLATFLLIRTFLFLFSNNLSSLTELFLSIIIGFICYITLSYIFKIQSLKVCVEWLCENKIIKLKK